MKHVKKPGVSPAVARALVLKMQRRKDQAEVKRALKDKEVVSQLCKQLMMKKSLRTMQDLVDKFTDSRADKICNAILEATTFMDAQEFVMSVLREMYVVTIQHCCDYSTGVLQHVFRIKERGLIPNWQEVVSEDYSSGLAKLKAGLPKKKGKLLGGNYVTEECPPWTPYHKEVLPAVAQSLLRQKQREEGDTGNEWSLFHERSETIH